MFRLFQEQKRKLFHTSVYESEVQLKKLYIQTCRRLPSYGCKVYQVKELLRGKTKKKVVNVICVKYSFWVELPIVYLIMRVYYLFVKLNFFTIRLTAMLNGYFHSKPDQNLNRAVFYKNNYRLRIIRC